MSFHDPLIHDKDHHKPIAAGDQITPATVPVSAKISNIVTVEADGLAVIPADVLSAQPDNIITLGADGRLHAELPPAPDPVDLISSDEGNNLTLGSDAKLYTPTPHAADFLSNEAENSLGLSAIDDKIYFRKDEPKDWISTDKDNMLRLGVDANLYVAASRSSAIDPGALISNNDGNIIHLGTDKKLLAKCCDPDPVNPADLISDCEDNLIVLGDDGKLCAAAVIPDPVNPDDLVSRDPGNAIHTYTSDNKLYVQALDPVNPADLISNECELNIISLGGDGKLCATVDPVDPDDLVSRDPGNAIHTYTSDNKLYAPAPDPVNPADLISDCENNTLALGSDGKLCAVEGEYVPLNGDFISNHQRTATVITEYEECVVDDGMTGPCVNITADLPNHVTYELSVPKYGHLNINITPAHSSVRKTIVAVISAARGHEYDIYIPEQLGVYIKESFNDDLLVSNVYDTGEDEDGEPWFEQTISNKVITFEFTSGVVIVSAHGNKSYNFNDVEKSDHYGRNGIITGYGNSVYIGGIQALPANALNESVYIGDYSLEAVRWRGFNNVAIGNNTQCGETCVSIGYSSGYQTYGGVFIGFNATAKGPGTSAVAVGWNAQSSQESVALGKSSSTASYKKSMALGADAQVTGDNQNQIGASGTTTYVYGAVQSRSDARDKADIAQSDLGLDFINRLNPVKFRWDYREDYKETVEKEITKETGAKERVQEVIEHPKDGSRKRGRFHNGFVAQDVKAVMDELGVDFGGYQDHTVNGGQDVLSLGYEEFIAPMVKAIQELTARVKDLEQQLKNQGE